jgi:hypothetical protein
LFVCPEVHLITFHSIAGFTSGKPGNQDVYEKYKRGPHLIIKARILQGDLLFISNITLHKFLKYIPEKKLYDKNKGNIWYGCVISLFFSEHFFSLLYLKWLLQGKI